MFYLLLLTYFLFFFPVIFKKYVMYRTAMRCAKKKQKKLMVVGNPDNGSYFNRKILYKILGPPYGRGDICIDLNGGDVNGKLEDVIKHFPSDSYVIFISQTLEYIDPKRIKETLQHLVRVSGGDIYNVAIDYPHIGYNNSLGYFKLKNLFTKTPPKYDRFEYRSLCDI